MDPHVKDVNGDSALGKAARSGHESVACLLLEAGADKDMALTNGRTALMLASQNGILGVVRLLLQSGAYKNVANNDGWTALMLASLDGHLKPCNCCWSPGLTSTWP